MKHALEPTVSVENPTPQFEEPTVRLSNNSQRMFLRSPWRDIRFFFFLVVYPR